MHEVSQYTVDTDVCDWQVGCGLLQQQEQWISQPLGYWSRTLTSAVKKPATTPEDCLVVLWAMLLLRSYLGPSRVIILTDHDTLRWFLASTDTSGKVTKWLLRLFELYFEIVHRAGVKKHAADALLRRTIEGTDKTNLDEELSVLMIDGTEAIRREIRRGNKIIRRRPTRKRTNQQPNGQQRQIDKKQAWTEMLDTQENDCACILSELTIGLPKSMCSVDTEGKLTQNWPMNGASQWYIPKIMRSRVFHLCHGFLLAGYPGKRRMCDKTPKRSSWPHISNDDYVTVLWRLSSTQSSWTNRKNWK